MFADSAITVVVLVLPPVEWTWMASSPINPTPFSTAMNDIKRSLRSPKAFWDVVLKGSTFDLVIVL